MQRFLWVAAASVAFCMLALSAPARAQGGVLVMNSADASLSVIDMAKMQEISRIPALREPHHVMLTPDGRDLLVGDTVGNQLIDLDPTTFAVRRRLPVADPYQLGFSPDAKYLVVNGLARNQVDIYQSGTYKLVKRFPLRSMPSHMAFSPDSSQVFISLQGTDDLADIDLRTMTVRWQARVGPAPAGVLWLDGRVLVADMGADYVAVVDPATGRVVRRVVTGKGAHQLFMSPDDRTVWVNNRVAGTVTTLDARTLAFIHRYRMPGGPDDLVFAPDGDVWFTLRFAHKVGVLDPATGAVHDIDVGRSPHGIFMNPHAVVK
jgi:DNA-binding beta-propeller fold protein YncE